MADAITVTVQNAAPVVTLGGSVPALTITGPQNAISVQGSPVVQVSGGDPELTVTVAGTQGPAGADGAQGPAGPTGAQGPAGADGADAEFPGGATEGQVLTADAQGDPIWADAASGGGSPDGADGAVQYSWGGEFAGSAVMSINESGATVRVNGEAEFQADPNRANGIVKVTRITGATGAPFSGATVGTGIGFYSFGGTLVGGAYVSNSSVFTLENRFGSKITFASGGNIEVSKLSVLETGSNFFPQIRMDRTGGKEVGWYVPSFGSEEMRGAVSRVDVITLKPTGAKIKGGLNLADLPTSATGLASGDIWNDGGTLKVVP